MTLRRGLVGLATLVAGLGFSSPASAFSCAPRTLLQQALAAAGVFEATVGTLVDTRVPRPSSAGPELVVAGSSEGPTFELTLGDVIGLRGESARTIRQTGRRLRPGTRYVFFANRHPDGGLTTGLCLPVVPARRAAGLKAWLASLAQPPTGGYLFGSVVIPPSSPEADDETPVEGARVTARGPVVVEAVADADGHFAFSGVPEGVYEVSVRPGAERSDMTVTKSATVVLIGDHAAASADFFAGVNGRVSGRVVDEAGQPVAKQMLLLTVAGSTRDSNRSSYGFATSDADGEYMAGGVRPGRYLLTLGDPYVPAHAVTTAGDSEIIIGWAEHVHVQPLVARTAETIIVEGLVLDAAGQPIEGGVYVEAVGPHGPYPMSGSAEETDSDGQFRLRLLRGVRYRFTVPDEDGAAAVVHEHVIDGTPIRIVLPR
jgi:protocatechuate 3,4-dioxygenase beta subunit